MTVCNVCGAPLESRDQAAFLCAAHIRRLPTEVLERYRAAADAIEDHRRLQFRIKKLGGIPPPVPRELLGALSRAWYAARAALNLGETRR